MNKYISDELHSKLGLEDLKNNKFENAVVDWDCC